MTGTPVYIADSDLHDCLEHPAMGAISFLNEIMDRYPQAISFAPGAPHLATLRDVDIRRLIDVFVDHLAVTTGTDSERARQVLLEYGPSGGVINALIADALRIDHGIAVDPASIVVTVGAQEAILVSLRTLIRSDRDLLAVVNPCYVGVVGAARLLDLRPVPVDETDDGPDLEQLREKCRAARRAGRSIRCLYVAPDYANPSGVVMDLAARQRLLEIAAAEELLIIEDTAYGFAAPAGTALPPLKALDRERRVVHLGTFAKIGFPGARVGYAVADQQVAGPDGGVVGVLASRLAAVKSMVTVNTSPVCQAVVGGMLLEHGGSLAELGRSKAALYRRNLRFLLDALDRRVASRPPLRAAVRWNRPRGGFFVRMDLPVPADVALLEMSADRHGVLWTPMSPFFLDGKGTHQIRLSCSYLDPDELEEGVRRLSNFLLDAITRDGA